jgi:glycine C-acetyltransferase
MKFLSDELDAMKQAGLYGTIRTLESPQGRGFISTEKIPESLLQQLPRLCNDPRLVAKVKEYTDKYGVGPGAVRTIAGTMSPHIELEKKLAAFKGAEAAIVIQSGFCANLTVIPTLAGGADDLIFSDSLNHASIIDACRLSKAKVVRYEHSDMADLKKKLEENGDVKGKKLLITDGVFSMDGDVAKLPEIVELCEKHGVIVAVDDAHGEGVLGRAAGASWTISASTAGLTWKSAPCPRLRRHGRHGGRERRARGLPAPEGRPNLFSSALTIPDVAANLASVEILQESETLVKKLWSNGDFLKKELKALGFDTGSSETPITPVIIGEASDAKAFSAKLFERGVFATAIVFPTVPRGTARIRAMVSAAHSEDDLRFAVEQFTAVGREMGILK